MFSTRPGFLERPDLEALLVNLGLDAGLCDEILKGDTEVSHEVLVGWAAEVQLSTDGITGLIQQEPHRDPHGTHTTALILLRPFPQMTRIELGIRPASPVDEGTTVQAIEAESGPDTRTVLPTLIRMPSSQGVGNFDPSRPGEPGTAWHVVSKKWWDTWQAILHFRLLTPHPSHSPTHPPRHVQEWSLPVTYGGEGPLENPSLEADIERLELEVAKGRRRTRSSKGTPEVLRVKSLSSGPPPIDNKPLLEKGGRLKVLIPRRMKPNTNPRHAGGPYSRHGLYSAPSTRVEGRPWMVRWRSCD